MKYKKSFIFICLIVCLFSIASISAGDVNDTAIANENQDSVDANMATAEVDNEKIENDVISSSSEDILGEKDNGTFTVLQNKINNVGDASTITLENDYAYTVSDDDALKKGIVVDGDQLIGDKTFTINGNGHIINGNKTARMFTLINDARLVLKNLTLTQGQGSDENIRGMIENVGGAIYSKHAKLTVINCTLTYNSADAWGGAIYAIDSSIHITDSQIAWNNAHCGAIYGDHCHINITDSQLTNNTAKSGGAIFGDYCHINITDSQLTNNTAGYGGAIYIENNGNMINMINLANTSFINNIAGKGAAVCKAEYGSNGIYMTITDSNFAENSGDYVISIEDNSTLNITGTTFIKNEGTVILASSICIIINDSDFTDNNGSYMHGAIYNINCNLTIINSHFTNNTAENGGAIYSTGNSILNIINVAFINNTATRYGGAIDADESCITITDCNFTNNTSNDIMGCGGAIYLESIPIISIKNTQFINNSVLGYSGDGGAIYMNNCSNITIEKCNFNLSKVGFYGGAIYAVRLINMKVIDSIFAQNTAEWCGGAIYYCGNNLNIENTIFKNNNANHGGAIFLNCNIYAPYSEQEWVEDYDGYQHYVTAYRVDGTFGNNVKINNSIFESNIASQKVGGAIYSLANNLSIEDTSFIKNSATDGGAIYLDSSTTTTVDGRTHAIESDGEYHYRVSYRTDSFGNNVKINNSIFESNIASNSGEAIIDQGVNTIIYNNINDTSIYGSTIFVKCNDTTISNNKFDGGKTSNPDQSGNNQTDTNNTNTTDDNKTDTTTTNTTVEPEITIPSLNQPSDDGSVEISLPLDATGTITLTINNEDYHFTVVNGVANVMIPDLSDGEYPYVITYSGDGKYSSFSDSGSLVVNKTSVGPVENQTNTTVNPNNKTDNITTENNTSQENTTVADNSNIVASNVKVVYAAGSFYTITVYGTDGKLADGATVTISGKISKTLTTKDGVAKFKVTNVPGTYKMTINALGKSVIKTLTVTKATPKLTASKKTFKKSTKTKKYTITLKTNKNKVMKNTWVTLKVNKKTYKVKTNSKGKATFKIKNLKKKGKYTAVVKYAGSKYYNAKTVKAKITIK